MDYQEYFDNGLISKDKEVDYEGLDNEDFYFETYNFFGEID